jgi:hypothetical protein
MTKRKYSYGEDVDLDTEVVRDKQGRRITEKRAAEIAEEALAQVRAGRPSLSGTRKASPQIAFRGLMNCRPASRRKRRLGE